MVEAKKAELEQGGPYPLDDFRHIDVIWHILERRTPSEWQKLDPDNTIANHLDNRRQLLARAWHIDNAILCALGEAHFGALDRKGKLTKLLHIIDHRVQALRDQGQSDSPEAQRLYGALKSVHGFAQGAGYNKEAIGPVFSLARRTPRD